MRETQHLERARGLHEDLELLEKAMTKELGDPANEKLKRADEVARDQVVATLLAAHVRGAERVPYFHRAVQLWERQEDGALLLAGESNRYQW